MTILVTGGQGQLATAIAKVDPSVRRAGRPELDFDRPETISSVFDATRPSLVVNAAAWTGVDAAERNLEAAMRANRDAPGILARLCADAGVPLIHISTDYVFDGEKGAPYRETDPSSPTGVYGASKLAGEQAALAAGGRVVILRTSWVYSPWGKNFIRTMLGAAQKTDRLRVVADQKGCPTSARELAVVVTAIAGRIAQDWRDEYAGVFHAAGSGWATWHGLAEAAFEEAGALGRATPVVEPISTQDWPTPAKRPPDSRLDCAKLERTFGLRQPDWRESVRQAVSELLDAGPA